MRLFSVLFSCLVIIAGAGLRAAADAGIPPKSEWSARASSPDEGDLRPSYAIDGDMETRYSSPSQDDEWIQFDLGRETVVSGMTLHWETAFGSAYAIAVSADGSAWKTVFETDHSDGHGDEIFFTPTPARYVKLVGIERATGWGYSLFEVDIHDGESAHRVVLEGQPGHDAAALWDGLPGTTWTSPAEPPFSLVVDLGRTVGTGGIWIDWGERHATAAELEVSKGGEHWEQMAELADGAGAFDVLEHDHRDITHLRLTVTAAAEPGPVEIREITLRSPNVRLGAQAGYKFAARQARKGLYPLQFLKEQVYWTVVGLPGDPEESLLDEYGTLERKGGGPSLTPLLELEGELVTALDAGRVEQHLRGGAFPIPGVAWKGLPVELEVEAFNRGGKGSSTTYVHYRLTNRSDAGQEGSLNLLLRPVQVNPSWQYGGMSPIHSLAAAPRGERALDIEVNEETAFVAVQAPRRFAAKVFRKGDIVEDLLAGDLPGDTSLEDERGALSGVLVFPFSLEPGASTGFVVAAPLYDDTGDVDRFIEEAALSSPSVRFEEAAREQERFWSAHVDRATIELPEQRVTDTLRSQVSYILVNRDGASIQPGSRNYNRAWIRDGSLTSAALLRMGLFAEVKEYLEWYAERVDDEGWVPPILNNDGTINKGFGWDNEYDSQGEFVYAMMEYYRFTRDRGFLVKHYDTLMRALAYLEMLRNRTLEPGYMADEEAPERFRGILPASISHEGYHPGKHSYWDVFWALKGWKDGIEAAREMGDAERAAWAEQNYAALRQSTRETIEATVAFKEIDYVPGCAELGDPDATSTAIAIFPCGEGDLPRRDLLEQSFENYYQDLEERFEPGWEGGFTPYEIRSVLALVELGHRDRAYALLDYMLGCRRPLNWNHFGEVVYGEYRRGGYIGDMPHTWVGSGYVNSIRGMLVQERKDTLVLLPGIPASWLEGEGIRLANLPTHFGRLNFSARMTREGLRVHVGGTFACSTLELVWPEGFIPSSITVDGEAWEDFNERSVHLPAAARTVLVTR